MKFSVLMAVYGGEKPEYLSKSLTSIWDEQSLQPDEIVLVRDGPLSESLEEIITHWKIKLASQIKIIAFPINLGLAVALNQGLLKCSNEIIARMDSDDISAPSRFKEQIEFLVTHEEVDILGSFARNIDEYGTKKDIRQVPEQHQDVLSNIWACPLIHPSIMFRKSAIIRVGSYKTTVSSRQEDYELWIRSARYGLIFHNLPTELLYYRIDEAVRKNTAWVGLNRLRIGWHAVTQFNPRLRSYLAISYPLLRSLLPAPMKNRLHLFAQRYDPRKQKRPS
ncbi:glycosyltransferase [Phyllobacterium sp. YR531]|uniref:glycosyltransferase n=1 Tax=Phyllobacterium sp. YR531 TaxID=1144343 RepID=UPI00026F869E|nr:glycosyltransferase [Phyllobacterium sp. YR531]EJN06346.1 glycosyl transferase [Phyllobacterium sp. YR531]